MVSIDIFYRHCRSSKTNRFNKSFHKENDRPFFSTKRRRTNAPLQRLTLLLRNTKCRIFLRCISETSNCTRKIRGPFFCPRSIVPHVCNAGRRTLLDLRKKNTSFKGERERFGLKVHLHLRNHLPSSMLCSILRC